MAELARGAKLALVIPLEKHAEGLVRAYGQARDAQWHRKLGWVVKHAALAKLAVPRLAEELARLQKKHTAHRMVAVNQYNTTQHSKNRTQSALDIL